MYEFVERFDVISAALVAHGSDEPDIDASRHVIDKYNISATMRRYMSKECMATINDTNTTAHVVIG